jgi:Tol biopolymer transport system component
VMNADGGDQQRLTTLGTSPGFPDWSPDGSQIVFHANRGDGNFDLFLMNADGSNIRRLTSTGSQIQPRWSPDGQRIAFVWYQTTAPPSSTTGGRIAIINTDGTGFRILTHSSLSDGSLTWSPDGSRIAFATFASLGGSMQGYAVLAIMNADGSGVRTLENTMFVGTPDWSWSGGRIYFSSNASGMGMIYSIRSDGRDQRRVTAMMAAGDGSPDSR